MACYTKLIIIVESTLLWCTDGSYTDGIPPSAMKLYYNWLKLTKEALILHQNNSIKKPLTMLTIWFPTIDTNS